MSNIYRSIWAVLPYTALVGKICLHNQTEVVQLQKNKNTFFLNFFVSPQIVRNIVAYTLFARCIVRWKDVTIRKHTCIRLILLLKNFNLGRYFLTRRDRVFILHMCIPCDKNFHMVPYFLTSWPWPWSLTYFWNTLTRFPLSDGERRCLLTTLIKWNHIFSCI